MSNNTQQLVITEHIAKLVELALSEDIGSGDVTSAALIPEKSLGRAEIYSKETCLICGLPLAQYVFRQISPELNVELLVSDGQEISSGQAVLGIQGSLRAILTGERTALNFLQRLSGIATKTAKLVKSIADTGTKLLDTRKTTPGFRALEKYAVAKGGGVNHRIGLFDAVLIKNNHLDALSGDVAQAVMLSRKQFAGTVEIEVRNLSELEQAIKAKPDKILFDNFNPTELSSAVKHTRSANPDIFLEASGGINERTLRSFAESGVDAVSVGELTHSVTAIDLSLRYLPR